MVETCIKCNKKISIWKAFFDDSDPYCENCWNARNERRRILGEEEWKKEYREENRKRMEKQILEDNKKLIREVYCSQCGKKFKIKDTDTNVISTLIGLIILLLTGFGWVSKRELNKCPNCGGKLYFSKEK